MTRCGSDVVDTRQLVVRGVSEGADGVIDVEQLHGGVEAPDGWHDTTGQQPTERVRVVASGEIGEAQD